ncbi:hypothetical protein GCM10009793_25380 [Brachybacterium phenoliresistens]
MALVNSARALREDFGLDVEVGWLICREERSDGERQADLDCYWAPVSGQLPSAPGGSERAWRSRAELFPMDLETAESPVRRKLLLVAEPIFSR